MRTRTLLMAALVVAAVIVTNRSSFGESYVDCDCSFFTDPELATISGGFVSNDGLEITFGIERAVLVNGVLLASSSFNISNGEAGQAQTLSGQGLANMVILRQNGDNNNIMPNVSANSQTGFFTYIQNTLDNTILKNVTQINASVNSLSMYRDTSLKLLMNQQLINSMK